jgi:hypothetical protein
MFVDAQLEFSDSQAITASAASTNIIDFNPAFDYNTVIDAGAGEPTFLVVTPSVTFAAAGAATLAIELRAYANEDKAIHQPLFFLLQRKRWAVSSQVNRLSLWRCLRPIINAF